MKRVEDIATAIEGVERRRGNPETPITSLSRDSRAVESGGLFAALAGDRVDGHDFVGAAVDRGASALLVESGRPAPADVAVLETDDTRAALGRLADWFFDHPSREIEVVGITGTNGKTSVSYLLEHIVDNAGWTPGIVGTVEYRWRDRSREAANTTPDGLVLQRTLREMVDDGVDIAILEVSSHGLELGRVEGTSFSVGVFTNLSRDHVGFHGSVEAYRRAKWRLFDHYLPRSADSRDRSPAAIVNVDGAEGRTLYDELCRRGELAIASHGLNEFESAGDRRHLAGRNLELDLTGVSMTIDESDGTSFAVSVGLPGRFNAENALGAVAAARMLGVAPDSIVEGLADVQGVPGRMESVGADLEGPSVVVDYAHTPDALRRALETLRPLVEGRLWAVFGCGGDRDASKRAPMGRIAARLADRVVVTSDNPRSEAPESIIDDIAAGVREAHRQLDDPDGWQRICDREEAIVETALRAAARDVILIAGKGHETYQEQNGRRRDFDDRRVALEALRRRGAST